jgi:hypothetical protein
MVVTMQPWVEKGESTLPNSQGTRSVSLLGAKRALREPITVALRSRAVDGSNAQKRFKDQCRRRERAINSKG